MKIKLRSFENEIDNEEHIQKVKYLYSIDDSIGLLGMDLFIPEEADPVEYFALRIKDIYRGYNAYNVYHGKYKYTVFKNWKDQFDFQLHKVKMY